MPLHLEPQGPRAITSEARHPTGGLSAESAAASGGLAALKNWGNQGHIWCSVDQPPGGGAIDTALYIGELLEVRGLLCICNKSSSNNDDSYVYVIKAVTTMMTITITEIITTLIMVIIRRSKGIRRATSKTEKI